VKARPRVLITCGTAMVPVTEGFLASHYVGQGYVRAITEGGGRALLVPHVAGFEEEIAADVMEAADGLLLAGGTDIDPATYGQTIRNDQTQQPDPSRDRLELALVAEARDRGIPILGICRGFQILNVAYGGTLDQHRPHRDSTIIQDPNLRIELTEVSLSAGSRAAQSVGAEKLGVYCLHHQSIDVVGDGLRVTGVAPDGLIEALEDPGADFILGVLWHPEQMLESEHSQSIYRSFLDAIGARK
jgi:putative glutamine amidotransferase